MRKAIRIPLLAASLIILVAGTVLATAGSGLTPVIVSRGIATDRVHFNTGEVKVQTKAPVAIVTQTITFAPSTIARVTTTGWHAHPGVVLVTVTAGSLTRYDGNCSPTVYTANTAKSAFIESGDHAGLVRNESTTTAAAVNVTYLVPEGVANTQLRIDKPNPGCPQS